MSVKKTSKGKIISILIVLLVIGSFASKRSESDESNTIGSSVNNIVGSTVEDSAQELPETDDVDIEDQASSTDDETIEYNGVPYKIIKVDGGDLSGERQLNVAVNVGYGDREYWAFTNEYGQLIGVIADKITLQDDSTESVNSDGRYYNNEAKVLKTEQEDLDEGHVIADSLGGVSNAYNITPQNSTLNRHGDQAYMEKVIRDAGGCENFVATITYPDSTTQIPSHYHFEYVINGESIVDDFDNLNPDEVNAGLSQETSEPSETDSNAALQESVVAEQTEETPVATEENDLSSIDTNGNGKVTIAEAETAGYAMPIYSDHWLYKYMDDRDGDGMVGE
ncbi:DNA/RNA non-specific endonuclease [Kineothrix sp. MB12-C1]|uniref:DNA/RNA non-specific endonuclease n=1 Tax=Kineothrix sp. MB12-C1 TaxID=3070215 RepID=UPI0027D2811A|nr:DNA/RNA non-specific endonuclease [Kineothrix sp. MB12-C1]WMC93219.1 DNA/RNA non-specific endonuclease [Kineothrix sp. MB12-C1]